MASRIFNQTLLKDSFQEGNLESTRNPLDRYSHFINNFREIQDTNCVKLPFDEIESWRDLFVLNKFDIFDLVQILLDCTAHQGILQHYSSFNSTQSLLHSYPDISTTFLDIQGYLTSIDLHSNMLKCITPDRMAKLDEVKNPQLFPRISGKCGKMEKHNYHYSEENVNVLSSVKYKSENISEVKFSNLESKIREPVILELTCPVTAKYNKSKTCIPQSKDNGDIVGNLMVNKKNKEVNRRSKNRSKRMQKKSKSVKKLPLDNNSENLLHSEKKRHDAKTSQNSDQQSTTNEYLSVNSEFSIVFEDVKATDPSYFEDSEDSDFSIVFEDSDHCGVAVVCKNSVHSLDSSLSENTDSENINLDQSRTQNSNFFVVCDSDSDFEIDLVSDGCFMEEDLVSCSSIFMTMNSNKANFGGSLSNVHPSFVINPLNYEVPLLSKENAAIRKVNRKWKKLTADLEGKPRQPTQVTFAHESKLVSVFSVEAYDRRGEWEQIRRDRMRFRKRISEVEKTLSPCLSPVHRAKVFKQMSTYFS